MREKKYSALGQRLAASGQERVRLTYAEMDELCAGLPEGANRRQFWENSLHSNQAKSWLEVGYVVDHVSLGHFVEFQRDPARAKDPGAGRETTANRTGQMPRSKKKIQGVDIPTPCPEELEKYLASWEQLEDYTDQEIALDDLFLRHCPENRSLSDILLKVASLNTFYSTYIFRPTPVARHILALHIDERLAKGDLTLVDDIQRVKFGETEKQLYSFATKYCSHHKPLVYPIYDSYVDKMLRYFRGVDGFCDFRNGELKDYSRFCEILFRFQQAYGLQAYSVKEIDRYLWQAGKKYFPNEYN